MERLRKIQKRATEIKDITKIMGGSALIASGVLFENNAESLNEKIAGIFLIGSGLSINYVVARSSDKRTNKLEEISRQREQELKEARIKQQLVKEVYKRQRRRSG